MKILLVIHGYPERYNAGSEVYTRCLAHELAVRHEVHVFTREENPLAPEYCMRQSVDDANPRVKLHIVNRPNSRDRYRHEGVDQRLAEVLDRIRPDVVHIGHLNHLSTSLVHEIAAREIPIVYTLHDFWLMCPRGQFLQQTTGPSHEPWKLCDRQEDHKCAERCYSRYFSGAASEDAVDVAYWTDWVSRRMAHVREVCERIDVFIAPSIHLRRRVVEEFGLPTEKVVHLDYGFDIKRLKGRARAAGEPFTFGFIGTHIPAKGIQHLIEAFGRVAGDSLLRVWGRPRGFDTDALHDLASGLPLGAAQRISWMGEYHNGDLVSVVFNHVDAIVVPSIWEENSPLVIHEALHARIPVVTADVGGMAEFVQHEVNGLLFRHRSPEALAMAMTRLAGSPALAARLGARGYLQSETGDVISIEAHVRELEQIYEQAMRRRDSARVTSLPGPWRITLDTNPDSCNIHCVMCEEHSPHSQLQRRRIAAGAPKRIMPIELVRRVLAEAAQNGLREVIPSTMGEPLLYEHFDELIGLCTQHGLRLNLTTNGTFPRRGAKGWASLIVPVASDVKISWNGATKHTHESIMVGSRWDEALASLQEFIAVRDAHAAAGGNRCRVTIQLTFLESNVLELPGMVKLAAEFGVDRVKGHHLWAHFEEIRDLSMRRNPEAIERWNAAVLEARRVAQATPTRYGGRVLLENIFLLDPAAVSDLAPGGMCPFLGREVWVSAEGRFNPCCAPDAQRRTLGEFGNLNDASLLETWRGDPYRMLVATYRNRILCRGCNMRRPMGAA